MTRQTSTPTAVLIGHGSRHQATAAAGREFADQVARTLGQPVKLGWLDYCNPPIEKVLADLAAQGIDTLSVQPLMLTPASHVTQDIPNALTGFAGHVDVAPPLGDPNFLCEIMTPLALELAKELPTKPTLFLVARDSHGPAFKEQAQRLAAMLTAATGLAVQVGYVGATDQKWEDVLTSLPDGPLLVLPTLLFPGKLWDQIAAHITDRAAPAMILPPLTQIPQMAQRVAQQIRDLQISMAHDC